MQYITCPKCGCNLDCGERCDCEKEETEEGVDKGNKWISESALFVAKTSCPMQG